MTEGAEDGYTTSAEPYFRGNDGMGSVDWRASWFDGLTTNLLGKGPMPGFPPPRRYLVGRLGGFPFVCIPDALLFLVMGTGFSGELLAPTEEFSFLFAIAVPWVGLSALTVIVASSERRLFRLGAIPVAIARPVILIYLTDSSEVGLGSIVFAGILAISALFFIGLAVWAVFTQADQCLLRRLGWFPEFCIPDGAIFLAIGVGFSLELLAPTESFSFFFSMTVLWVGLGVLTAMTASSEQWLLKLAAIPLAVSRPASLVCLASFSGEGVADRYLVGSNAVMLAISALLFLALAVWAAVCDRPEKPGPISA